MSTRASRLGPAKARARIIPAMSVRWPHCFALDEKSRRPLKLDIAQDVIAASGKGIASGAISVAEIFAALRVYCSNTADLAACKQGAPRIDLSGKPVGRVSAAEARFAAAEVAKRQPSGKAKPRCRGTGAKVTTNAHHSPAL